MVRKYKQTTSQNIKSYFRDTGILLALLKNSFGRTTLTSPSSWPYLERIALEQTLQTLEIRREEAFYWRTSHGAELDLLIQYQEKQLGFEFKFADAPKNKI